MKLTTIILIIHLSMNLSAQSKFHITDTLTIMSDTTYLIYSKGWYGDSVVSIFSTTFPAFCEAFEVYYDKSLKSLAFRSESFEDSCVSSDYWRSGQLKQRTVYYRNERRYPVCGWDEAYCENGTRIYKGPAVCQWGKYQIVLFHCNGNKRLEYYQMDSGIDGKMTRWFENGNLESEAFFEENNRVNTWKYYNEVGKLIKEEEYENDKLISTKNY